MQSYITASYLMGLITSKVRANYIWDYEGEEYYLYSPVELESDDFELYLFSTFGKVVINNDHFVAAKVVAGHHVWLEGGIGTEAISIDSFGIDYSFEPNVPERHKPAIKALFSGWFMVIYMIAVERNLPIILNPSSARAANFWRRYGFVGNEEAMILIP